MDGIFLYSEATPPHTAFVFDLQRFTDVGTLDALKQAITNGDTEIKLTAPIDLNGATQTISKNTTLDLNGCTLTVQT